MMSSCFPAFEATLAEPLNFGHVLEIGGKTKRDADSITIDLSKTKATFDNCSDDKYLQINLNFIEKSIVFIQFDSESKKKTEFSMKLVSSEFLNDFKFYIMLAESMFHIALNNKPLINFKYNLSLSKLHIQAVKIAGKLEYIKQLNHHKYFPLVWPPIQIIEDALDFSNDQPMPFKPGHIIVIKARLEGNSNGRFIIHFRHARDNKRQELHVSVRFDTKTIVRNSKFHETDDSLAFGQEEFDSVDVFPFKDFKKPFTLAVAFCENQLRFAKDGEFLFNFSFRSPNILPYIMGPKIFGIDGVNVRVMGVEHFSQEDNFCRDFEKYSA